MADSFTDDICGLSGLLPSFTIRLVGLLLQRESTKLQTRLWAVKFYACAYRLTQSYFLHFRLMQRDAYDILRKESFVTYFGAEGSGIKLAARAVLLDEAVGVGEVQASVSSENNVQRSEVPLFVY
jgi:hypothetical protein